MYFLLRFGLLTFSIVLILGCEKKDNSQFNAESQSANKKIKNYIKNAQLEQLKRTSHDNTKYTSSFYIDYSNTILDTLNRDAIDYEFYYTPIYYNSSKSQYVGALIGYELPSGRVFNFMYRATSLQNIITVHVECLRGDDIGYFNVNTTTEQVVAGDTSTTTPIDFYTHRQRSWFSCTRECISDAHYVCRQSLECAILLVMANWNGSPKGLGNLSIAIACGIVCAENSGIDLIPAI